MDSQTVCCAGRFVNSLTQGRVRVNRCFDLLIGCLERDSEAKLSNQLGSFRTDNMRAEDFAVWFGDNEFDETFGFFDRECFAVGRKRKLSNFKFQSLFFGGLLCKPDAGYLGLAIGASWKSAYALRFMSSEHAFHSLDCFPARHMSKPGRPDHVACGVDATYVRSIA